MVSAIVPVEEVDQVAYAIEQVRMVRSLLIGLRKSSIFVKDTDYGRFGNATKDTLLKPGAQKIIRALKARAVFSAVEIVQDPETGYYSYDCDCDLVDVETGKYIPGGNGTGHCNSFEKDYWRWQWVLEYQLPSSVDKDSLEKRTTRNGKIQYRIPNPNIMGFWNTAKKMARKRAMVDAASGGSNASEFFTVDLEDFEEEGDIIDGEITGTTTTTTTTSNGNGDSPSSSNGNGTPPQPASGLGASKWWAQAVDKLANMHFSEDKDKSSLFLEDLLRQKVINLGMGGSDAFVAIEAHVKANPQSVLLHDLPTGTKWDEFPKSARGTVFGEWCEFTNSGDRDKTAKTFSALIASDWLKPTYSDVVNATAVAQAYLNNIGMGEEAIKSYVLKWNDGGNNYYESLQAFVQSCVDSDFDTNDTYGFRMIVHKADLWKHHQATGSETWSLPELRDLVIRLFDHENHANNALKEIGLPDGLSLTRAVHYVIDFRLTKEWEATEAELKTLGIMDKLKAMNPMTAVTIGNFYEECKFTLSEMREATGGVELGEDEESKPEWWDDLVKSIAKQYHDDKESASIHFLEDLWGTDDEFQKSKSFEQAELYVMNVNGDIPF